jgi:hypothetical protein
MLAVVERKLDLSANVAPIGEPTERVRVSNGFGKRG